MAAAGAAMATATKASISQTASQARGVDCRAATKAADKRGDAHGHAAPSGHGGKFGGALHGFANVAEMIGSASVDGDGFAFGRAQRAERLAWKKTNKEKVILSSTLCYKVKWLDCVEEARG